MCVCVCYLYKLEYVITSKVYHACARVHRQRASGLPSLKERTWTRRSTFKWSRHALKIGPIRSRPTTTTTASTRHVIRTVAKWLKLWKLWSARERWPRWRRHTGRSTALIAIPGHGRLHLIPRLLWWWQRWLLLLHLLFFRRHVLHVTSWCCC